MRLQTIDIAESRASATSVYPWIRDRVSAFCVILMIGRRHDLYVGKLPNGEFAWRVRRGGRRGRIIAAGIATDLWQAVAQAENAVERHAEGGFIIYDGGKAI